MFSKINYNTEIGSESETPSELTVEFRNEACTEYNDENLLHSIVRGATVSSADSYFSCMDELVKYNNDLRDEYSLDLFCGVKEISKRELELTISGFNSDLFGDDVLLEDVTVIHSNSSPLSGAHRNL